MPGVIPLLCITPATGKVRRYVRGKKVETAEITPGGLFFLDDLNNFRLYGMLRDDEPTGGNAA